MDIIGIGAEAVLYKDENCVQKNRIKKGYRLSPIDERLRKARTKKEAKIMGLLHLKGFNVPCIYESKDTFSLKIDFIKGKKVRDALNSANISKYSKEIAQFVASIHDLGIIHGDLTTSNMIINDKDEKIYFIDFGLSVNSTKVEDKAVDLHLFQQAMESKHYRLEKEGMKIFLEEYEKCSKNGKETLDRLKKVEERGRNKLKI